jgi:hypothetical protein
MRTDMHTLHEIAIHAGDCFAPGRMRATVVWEKDATAPQDSTLGLQQTVEVPIRGGILVFPRLCYVGEDVVLQVHSTTDLGKAVDLTSRVLSLVAAKILPRARSGSATSDKTSLN